MATTDMVPYSNGNGAAMVPAQDQRMALEPRTFEQGMALAKIVVESGMFGVKNAADAFVRISTGVALGLSAVQSLRGIYVISGKAGLSADLMQALCLQSHDCEYFRMVESTTTKARFVAKRRNDPTPTELAFTMEDAKTAGLASNAMYTKFPAQMLRARCIAALARLVFPERCHGLYTPDEIKIGTVMPDEIPEAEYTAAPEPMATAEVAVAAQKVADAANDWEAIAITLQTSLDAAESLEAIGELSGQATPTFKDAPKATRQKVAGLFKAARARLTPHVDMTREPTAAE
jgi:hypothetical protein